MKLPASPSLRGAQPFSAPLQIETHNCIFYFTHSLRQGLRREVKETERSQQTDKKSCVRISLSLSLYLLPYDVEVVHCVRNCISM